MNKPVPIGTLEGRLSGYLAAALSNYLTKAEGSNVPACKGDSVWHGAITDFKFALAALEALGVLLPQKASDRRIFVVDVDKMPEFLATRDVSGKIPQIVEAFVRVACGYGGLPDHRDWFNCPENWIAEMRYLSLSGFAAQDNSRFRWTDVIEPIMQAAGCWNNDGQSFEALRKIQLGDDCERAWQTMPDTLRQRILSSNIDFFELAKILALSWKDGRWKAFDLDESFVISGQIPLAQALIDRAQAS